MMFQHRIRFQQGWADTDRAARAVRVGDRLLPPFVDVTFPGIDGQPSLFMRLEVVDGVPVCVEVRVERSEGGREVRTLDLRAVRLQDWTDDIFAAFAAEIVDESNGVIIAKSSDDDLVDLETVRQFQAARKGKGARKLDRAFLEKAAAVYRDQFDARPIEAVAGAFGVSTRTASLYITSARRAGILPETSRGRKAK
jgi:hypothetical protein